MTDKILFKDGNHSVGLQDILGIKILGPVSDIKTFFECFDKYIDKSKLSYSPKLISDSLYRRSIKFEDLNKTEKLMKEIEKQFSKIRIKDINWEEFSYISKDSSLNLLTESLSNLFFRYFKAFNGGIESVNICRKIKRYEGSNFSIRLVCSDLPFNVLDRQITEEQLDALSEDSKPIWMVPRFIEKKMDDHIKMIEKRNDDIIRKRKEKQKIASDLLLHEINGLDEIKDKSQNTLDTKDLTKLLNSELDAISNRITDKECNAIKKYIDDNRFEDAYKFLVRIYNKRKVKIPIELKKAGEILNPKKDTSKEVHRLAEK